MNDDAVTEDTVSPARTAMLSMGVEADEISRRAMTGEISLRELGDSLARLEQENAVWLNLARDSDPELVETYERGARLLKALGSILGGTRIGGGTR